MVASRHIFKEIKILQSFLIIYEATLKVLKIYALARLQRNLISGSKSVNNVKWRQRNKLIAVIYFFVFVCYCVKNNSVREYGRYMPLKVHII